MAESVSDNWDFNLNYLIGDSQVTASQPNPEDKKQISIIKRKIVASSALINKYHNRRQALSVTEKKLIASNDSKLLRLETVANLEKVQEKLNHQIGELKASNDEYAQKLLQFDAVQSHTNQLKMLVKEYQLKINSLEIEKKLLSKNNTERPLKKKEISKNKGAKGKMNKQDSKAVQNIELGIGNLIEGCAFNDKILNKDSNSSVNNSIGKLFPDQREKRIKCYIDELKQWINKQYNNINQNPPEGIESTGHCSSDPDNEQQVSQRLMHSFKDLMQLLKKYYDDNDSAKKDETADLKALVKEYETLMIENKIKSDKMKETIETLTRQNMEICKQVQESKKLDNRNKYLETENDHNSNDSVFDDETMSLDNISSPFRNKNKEVSEFLSENVELLLKVKTTEFNNPVPVEQDIGIFMTDNSNSNVESGSENTLLQIIDDGIELEGDTDENTELENSCYSVDTGRGSSPAISDSEGLTSPEYCIDSPECAYIGTKYKFTDNQPSSSHLRSKLNYIFVDQQNIHDGEIEKILNGMKFQVEMMKPLSPTPVQHETNEKTQGSEYSINVDLESFRYFATVLHILTLEKENALKFDTNECYFDPKKISIDTFENLAKRLTRIGNFLKDHSFAAQKMIRPNPCDLLNNDETHNKSLRPKSVLTEKKHESKRLHVSNKIVNECTVNKRRRHSDTVSYRKK